MKNEPCFFDSIWDNQWLKMDEWNGGYSQQKVEEG